MEINYMDEHTISSENIIQACLSIIEDSACQLSVDKSKYDQEVSTALEYIEKLLPFKIGSKIRFDMDSTMGYILKVSGEILNIYLHGNSLMITIGADNPSLHAYQNKSLPKYIDIEWANMKNIIGVD